MLKHCYWLIVEILRKLEQIWGWGWAELMYTYSWSRIFSGNSWVARPGNHVLVSMSATSKFLSSTSPCLPPEARWQQTKQKLVSCNTNRIETEPCRQSTHPCAWSHHLYIWIIYTCFCMHLMLTLFPRQPMIPEPMHDTSRWWMSGLRPQPLRPCFQLANNKV